MPSRALIAACLSTAAVVATPSVLPGSPAGAETASSGGSAAPTVTVTSQELLEATSELPGQDYAIEQAIAVDGTPIGAPIILTATSTTETASSTRAGRSTAQGCRRVTVRNEHETLLGFTAFYYNTWSEWCWDRGARAVSNVRTGQFFSQVAGTFYYRGLPLKEETYYPYVDGYNKSGHRHNRQSHWESCIVQYGCVGSFYPRNAINAHHDGTYAWSAS